MLDKNETPHLFSNLSKSKHFILVFWFWYHYNKKKEKGIGLWDENQYFQYKENILFTNQNDYTHENYYYQIYFDRLIII